MYNAAVLNHQPVPDFPTEEDNSNNGQIDETDHNEEDKFVLPPVQLDDIDILAIDGIIDTSSEEDASCDAGKDSFVPGYDDEINSEPNTIVDTGFNGPIQGQIDCSSNSSVDLDDDGQRSTIQENKSQENQDAQSDGHGETQNASAQVNVVQQNARELGSVESTSSANASELTCSSEVVENESNAIKSITRTRNLDGQVYITEELWNNIKITYISGQKIIPKVEAVKVKTNDKLSGNLPFHENVRCSELS